MNDGPRKVVREYRKLMLQVMREKDQLAALLDDVADHPVSATVAAALASDKALSLMREDLAVTRELCRAISDAMSGEPAG